MADIQVTLGLDDGDYRAGLTRAQQLAQSFGNTAERSLGGLDRGFNRLSGALQTINARLTSFTGLLVGAGLTAFVGRTLAAADQLNDMAAALGVTTEAILEMQSAAIASGSNIDGLAGMIGRLEVSSQNAVEGSQNLQDAFQRLGIGAKTIADLSPDQLFNVVAQRLAAIEDPATRAATKVELLGRSAMMWNPADYNRGLAQVAGTMGQTAASTERAAEIFGRFERLGNDVKNAFLGMVDPVLGLVENITAMTGPISAAQVIAGTLAATLAGLAAGAVASGLKSLVGIFTSLGAAMNMSTAATTGQAASLTQTAVTAEVASARFILLRGAMERLGRAIATTEAEQAKLSILTTQGRVGTAQYEQTVKKLETSKLNLAAAETALSNTMARVNTISQTVSASTQRQAAEISATTAAVQANTLATNVNSTAQAANAAQITVAARAWGILKASIGMTLQGLLAFVSGFQIGQMLYDQFELARVAGLKLAHGLGYLGAAAGYAIETLRGLAELDVGAAWERQTARVRRMQEIFATQTAEGLRRDVGEIQLPEIKMPTVPKIQLGQDGFAATDRQRAAISNLKEQYNNILEQTRLMNLLNARTNQRVGLEAELATASRAEREARLAGFDAETKRLQDIARLNEQIQKQRTAISLIKPENKQEIAAQQRVVTALEAQRSAINNISAAAEQQRRRQVEITQQTEMAVAMVDQMRSARLGQLAIENQIAQVGQTVARQRQLDFENQVRNEAELLIARRRSQLAAGEEVGAAERAALTEQVRQNLQGQLDLQLRLVDAEQQRALVVEGLNRRFELEKNIRDAQAEVAEQTLPAIQRIEAQLVRAAEERARAYAQAAEIAGRPLSLEENVRQTQEAINQARELAAVQQQAFEASRSFSYGWRTALVEFRDAAMNTAAQVRRGFDSLVNNMNSGLANFVKTGKFNFRDFAKSVVQDLITIYLQAQMTQVLMNTIGMATNLFSAGAGAAGGGGGNLVPIGATTMRAIGGPVRGGNPYIVGERGPELFVPNSTGRIIPEVPTGGSNSAPPNITYNINAVDAASFRDLVARDPEFIYQITERGRRSNGTVNTRR